MLRSRITLFVITGLLFAASLVLAESAYGSCSSPANPIEAENCLPGNPQSDWQVTGSGDPTIQGFATDISVNVGQTISFKVNTNATNYTLEIYRMGYYGGLGARRITVLTPSVQLPQSQPACMTDNSTFLLDCGNWSVSASWNVPANATSGVYFVHLVRQDTGGDSHIFFIVRNDASQSAILYQTSDLTWQAYNNYGGHSLYGATNFDLTNRGYKVSYNRPSNTRSFEAATFIFNAEYPMIRWLEANGYDVSYFTGVDAVRNASLIPNHKMYMSSGHDEYWDGMQRANVQAARDAGVHLAFFSGNEMFWKTRWENSIDGSNTPYRTLVCYKETYGDVIDPLDPPVWTGTWRDPTKSPPADGGRPENALTGTLFKVNGPGTDNTDLSMKVPSDDGQMRFWRNTSLANLPLNQTATLPPGTLGYEWDIDPQNSVRPAGLFYLSTATYNLTSDYLLDFGATYGAGTATHHVTMYRAASGALVFGAGSVQWSWGLDSDHDGDINPNPDPDMQQATVNLFADMGAQPATLQAGLQPATQSTDTLPPVSTITSPAYGGSVNVGPVTISGTATDSGGGVVAGVEVSTDGGQTWHPAIGRANWSYTWNPTAVGTAALMSRAVDDSGNLENPATSGGNPMGGVQVTVNPQVCPCSIWNASGTPGLVDSGDPASIEVGVKFRSDNDGSITGIRFYKSGSNTGTHIGHLWTSNGTLLATATFSGESNSGWQQVQLSSPVSISANTTYIVSYFAPKGHYSADVGYFLNGGVDNPPLHALADGVAGHNGVYVYTQTAGAFPTVSYAGTNYWVDVVFVSGTTFDLEGQISGIGGGGATVTLSGAANATTTADAAGNYNFAGLVNGTYTITPSNPGVAFTPPSRTVTLNGLSLNNLNFSAAAINPLSISGNISGSGGPGTIVNLTGPASLSVVADSSGNYTFNGLIAGTYSITPTEAGYIFTPSTQQVTLTSSNATGVGFTAQPCPCTSIWLPNATPTVVDSGDNASVEVGVRFHSDVAGHIQALRFYKANTNAGTHVAHIWSNTGTLLGSATFSNESSSGWQEVVFLNPVPITANTPYVASYFAPAGHYSFDAHYFATSGVDNPPLHAYQDLYGTVDGIFAYGSTPNFPNAGYQSGNYWVDVVFMPSPPHNLSGTITGSGGPSATVTLSGGANRTTTADSSGNFSFTNIYDGTYVITPTQSGYAFTDASQNVTMNGSDVTGVMFGTIPNCSPCNSIWLTTAAPNASDSGDAASVNVGVKFRTDTDGFVVGIRFYKSVLNTGTHVGTLWTNTGTPLGSVTFSNESEFGWQQATFSSPILILANTTYVISYLTAVGHYAADLNAFATNGVDSPPVHALANGVDGPDGVFAYSSTTAFPNSWYLAANYWVDVLFTPTSATHTISGTISGPGGANASVKLSGASSATTTADGAGNYSFTGVGDGGYWVTPVLNGYAYTPNVQAVTVAGLDVTGVNFGTVLICPCNTIWQASASPTTVDGGDSASVNVGVRFRADADGYIAGIRFYKAALNTGTHIGTLWSNTGTQLATATFTTESQSGWQQVLFNSPVPVTANTTYVASYLAPAGHYSADLNTFATNNVDNPPLHALANGFDGPNGVFLYGTTTAFPTQTYQASNYWVDVIYANPQDYTIAGTISGPGAAGATVNLSGTASASTTSNAAGNYSFNQLANGSYTVSPSQAGFTYSPSSQTVTVSSAHVFNVNFTSAGQTFTISGTISGPGGPGATVSLTGASSATTTADGSGNYSFSGLTNGSYVVTPTQTSYVFTPASQNVTIAGSNGTANFSSVQTFSITGTLSGPGGPNATVNLTGSATSTTTADGSGNYSFTGLANGSYVVTPSQAGYVFTPTSQSLTIAGTNGTANFSSALQTFSISGTISGAGGPNASVNLFGPSIMTVSADGAGNYVFSGLLNGSYIVTPGNQGYVFTPASADVVINGSNYTGLNFTTLSGCPTCDTIWGASAAPNVSASGDPTSMELGVKIRADNDGYITGLRFYKATNNTGTHIAHLWSSSGTLLGTVTVTGESAAGWQQMMFASPIPIVANTTYVASYLAPSGHYSADASFFASSGVNNAPLHALANGVDGPNGVFLATSTGGFPTSTNNSTNYWVDVVYNNSLGYSIMGTISGPGGAGATVKLTGAATSSTTADASGNYSFNSLANGSYTVTPSNGTYVFTPASQPVTINNAHVMNVNFSSVSVSVSSLTLNPTSVPSGATSLGTVTLSGPAPSGGAVVTLSSSNTSAAQVPPSVTVAANATTATFTVTTSSVSADTSLTISATLGTTQTAPFTVTSAVLSSVTVSPTSVTGGTSSTGTVTLTKAAPSGGAVVALSSNNTAAAQVPASVTVLAGATTATFTVTTTPVTTNTSVTITGIYGSTKTTNLTVMAPTLVGNGSGITVSPSSVIGGTSSTGTAKLTGPAPAGGSVVALSSSNTAAAQVPSSVTVPAGATTANFTITTSPVSSNTSVIITGVYGVTRTASLTVKSPNLNSITVSPTSVIGATSSTGTATLSGPAPAGGSVVTLSSSNTAAAQVPASVTVAAGATTATFTITTSPVASNATVTITGTYVTTKTATLTVQAATLSSISLSPNSVTGGTSSTGTATLNGPAPAGGAVVTLSSSNTSAAQVPASVTVAANATTATFTVTTNPVTSNTNVTITGTYGISKSATLTVKAPILSSLTLNPTSVVGGTSSIGTVTLTGPAPSGGTIVTLSSSNTTVATVPSSVTVAAGNTSATFTVTTRTQTTTKTVTISATKGVTLTAPLTVTP